MKYYGHEVIEVKVKGMAPSKFISATFKATVTTKAPTGPAAKELAKGRIDQIKAVIARFAKDAEIVTDRLKTSFAVDVHTEYVGNEHVQKGYKSVYSITFEAKNVAQATALHDALTSIEGIASPSPVFNFDESPEVHALAFQDAVTQAKRKFADELRAVNLPADTYKIVSWQLNSERTLGGGKFLALVEDSESNAVSVEPGKAIYELPLAFAFVQKD